MKKIIYSLVIMIAAGSLFTSCVTNTEPQGIKDIREAKANYLDALANLRAADAEKVKAEATLVQAQAATEQARAALVQAAAKAKEIENDYTAAENAIALDTAKAAAEVFLAQQELALAKAEEALRAYLVKVEEQSKQLTWTEQQIVWAYTRAYNKVIDKQKDVRYADSVLYAATYTKEGVLRVEAAKANEQRNIATATANIARAQAKYDEFSEMAEEEIAKYDVWAAEVKALEDSVHNYEYVLADIKKAEALAKIEYADAFDAFFDELADAQKDVQEAVDAVDDGFNFKGEYKLPTTGKTVVDNFSKNVNDNLAEFRVSDDGKLKVNSSKKGDVEKEIFGDEKNPDNYSLAGIIDALKRDSVVVDKIINDTTGLSAAVAKVKKAYADTKKVLEAGIDKYEPYVAAKKAFEDTKAEADQKEKDAAGAIDYLLKAIKGAQKEQIGTVVKLEKAQQDAIENGIINYGKAVYAYFGNVERDSVVTYAYNSKTGKSVEKKVALKVLTKDDFDTFASDDAGTKYRTVFSEEECTTAISAKYLAYNIVLKQINNISQNLIKRTSEESDIRDFSKETVADWWIKTRPAKAEGVSYHYAASKHFVNGDDVRFEYSKLSTKEQAKVDAHREFYTKVYGPFWNVTVTAPAEGQKLQDSIKIGYSEKTFTDPYVIPVFSAVNVETPVYNPKDSSFNFNNLKYNDNDSELKIIKEKLGKNYISIKEDGYYTLYAQTLAAAQIASMVEDYKENTKALAALEDVVAKVEVAFNTTVSKVADAEAVADSVVKAYLGEDIVKAALAGDYKGQKKAINLWKYFKADFVVDVQKVSDKYNVEAFTETFVDEEAGEYNLGGLQLEAAEENIPDYAEFIAENAAAKAEIKAAQDGCDALARIINEYAQDIAKLDKNFRWGDSETIDAFVRAKWAWLLASIEQEIKDAQTAKAEAEGVLAKLEAGYGADQAAIEKAEDALAKAKQALEQAELEFAVAEEAYKAVLAAHGIAE